MNSFGSALSCIASVFDLRLLAYTRGYLFRTPFLHTFLIVVAAAVVYPVKADIVSALKAKIKVQNTRRHHNSCVFFPDYLGYKSFIALGEENL